VGSSDPGYSFGYAESAGNTLRPATMLTKTQQGLKGSIKSLEPTADGVVRSAIAVHVASRRWLSFFR
jgi:hypothetical protein